ncbi:MAG: DMT family transporter [Clostridiaceae bacterium]|nr:DMT family transporter [Clostridiaceae bacterium]
MKGIFFAITAGLFIAMQQVFNTRLGERIGFWETNTFVHGSGFVFSLILLMIAGTGSFSKIVETNKLYLLGGMLGVIIVFSAMTAVSNLGATYSVAILLVTQLIAATVIDSLGLFGSPIIGFDITKLLGIIIMIAGIIVFKLKG